MKCKNYLIKYYFRPLINRKKKRKTVHIKSNTLILDSIDNSNKIQVNKQKIISDLKNKFKSNNIFDNSKKYFNTFFRKNPHNLKTLFFQKKLSNNIFNNKSNSNIQIISNSSISNQNSTIQKIPEQSQKTILTYNNKNRSRNFPIILPKNFVVLNPSFIKNNLTDYRPLSSRIISHRNNFKDEKDENIFSTRNNSFTTNHIALISTNSETDYNNKTISFSNNSMNLNKNISNKIKSKKYLSQLSQISEKIKKEKNIETSEGSSANNIMIKKEKKDKKFLFQKKKSLFNFKNKIQQNLFSVNKNKKETNYMSPLIHKKKKIINDFDLVISLQKSDLTNFKNKKFLNKFVNIEQINNKITENEKIKKENLLINMNNYIISKFFKFKKLENFIQINKQDELNKIYYSKSNEILNRINYIYNYQKIKDKNKLKKKFITNILSNGIKMFLREFYFSINLTPFNINKLLFNQTKKLSKKKSSLKKENSFNNKYRLNTLLSNFKKKDFSINLSPQIRHNQSCFICEINTFNLIIDKIERKKKILLKNFILNYFVSKDFIINEKNNILKKSIKSVFYKKKFIKKKVIIKNKKTSSYISEDNTTKNDDIIRNCSRKKTYEKKKVTEKNNEIFPFNKEQKIKKKLKIFKSSFFERKHIRKSILMPRRSTITSLIKKAIENGVNINENKMNDEEINEILKTFYKTDSLLHKESVLSKTENLKQTFSKTLKTNLERIVYLIKDSNFPGFKSLYEKFCNNPDIIDKNGDSLLNLAVQANNFQIVDFLLNEGADPNISNVRVYFIF